MWLLLLLIFLAKDSAGGSQDVLGVLGAGHLFPFVEYGLPILVADAKRTELVVGGLLVSHA